jgi:hypothetical protein
MTQSLSELMEESIQIAWDYLDRSGELGEPGHASLFLSNTIEKMIRKGTRSRLILSNKAITTYLHFMAAPPKPPRDEMLQLL